MAKRKKFGVWQIILIVIAVLILLSIVLNAVSTGTGHSIRTSSSRSDSLFKTTHTETKYGLFGKETKSKDCPFWNRNC